MSARIPRSFIDDLLSRVDIVDVIDARVPLKKAGKDYKACCPFHDEKTPSFTVSQDKQFYHCFGCGAHGSAIGFLMEYEHMNFPEAVEELAARAGIEVPREAAAATKSERADDLIPILKQAQRFYQQQLRAPAGRAAVDYLKKRGVSGEIAAAFNLGYAADAWNGLLNAVGTAAAAQAALARAGLTVKKDGGGYYDRFRARLMFPIEDYRGRLIGFGGRVIGAGEPKYLNSPDTPLFHKGRELYGLFRAREAIRAANRVLVVEGYMDVIALAQFGVDYTVATLGTATTRDHLERLFRFAPEVVFCFDGDRAGREAAWRALENALPVVHAGRQAAFLFLPEGEDPDTLVRKEGRAAFEARLRNAIALPDLFFQTLAQRVDLQRLDGRARLVELARPLLAAMQPDALRSLMLERLAELAQLPPQRLDALVGRPASAPVSVRAPQGRATPDRKPSLVRLAVALLLHEPGLAAGYTTQCEALAGSDEPGMDLLRELLNVLAREPHLRTGALVERFRGSPHEGAIGKLAVWRHPVLEQDRAAELAGVMRGLRRAANERATERLLLKERTQGRLDAADKAELRRLLEEKTRLLSGNPRET